MYFDIFETVEDVKKRYRMLSKLFHPDHGGPEELMVELNKYYKKRIEEIEYISFAHEGVLEDEYDYEEYQRKTDSILAFALINKNFDSNWINSVVEKYDVHEYPEHVRNSIDNIFTRFRVEEKLTEYREKNKNKKKN